MPTLFKQLQTARDHEPPPPPGSPVTRAEIAKTSSKRQASRTSQARVEARKEFLEATTKGTGDEVYTNPESLPPVDLAYNNFQRIYPKFAETWAIDDLRDREYFHLEENQHVCMDYCGFGLFSYYQQVINKASSSFGLAYISANLATHALYGAADEGTAEAYIRRRVMDYLNVNEREYSMVFTASRGSAFKLLAESYPFHLNQRLLTVYDFESEAVNWMVECAKQKGAKIMSAAFKWPSLRVGTTDLKKQLQEKKKRSESAKGLFVFPVQSRMTGAKYSYQWMSQAQQSKWHVLLDASALGPKDMDSLGLSLFRPDFIVSSFYKVFGTDPTGFGCLFIKNSAIHSLHNSSRARAVGMVRIVSISNSGTDGSDSKEAEDEEAEFQRSAWRLDQQAVHAMSSFSGPVSSFYSQDKGKGGDVVTVGTDSRKDSRRQAAKLLTSNGKGGSEIEHSGTLRRVSEIDEEDVSEIGSSGFLRHPRGGIGEIEDEDASEIQFSGQLTHPRYGSGRSVGEIEEEVPADAASEIEHSVALSRQNSGRRFSQIELRCEQRARAISLREHLHLIDHLDDSRLGSLGRVREIEEECETSMIPRFHRAPGRRSNSLDADEGFDGRFSETLDSFRRRSGDLDEEDDGRGGDYGGLPSNGNRHVSGGQFDSSPEGGVRIIAEGEDVEEGEGPDEDEDEDGMNVVRLRSKSARDESPVEEGPELSGMLLRRPLSDIEEEKGEAEDKIQWDATDDEEDRQQVSANSGTGIRDSGVVEEPQPGRDRESEAVQEMEIEAAEKATESRKESAKSSRAASRVDSNKKGDSIKARLQKFVNRATFRRLAGKEPSEFQEHGVRGLVDKFQSQSVGRESQAIPSNAPQKSPSPLYKRRSTTATAELVPPETPRTSGAASVELRSGGSGNDGDGVASCSYTGVENPDANAGQAGRRAYENRSPDRTETRRNGLRDRTSCEARSIVPWSSERPEEAMKEAHESKSPGPTQCRNAHQASSSVASRAEERPQGSRKASPARVPTFSSSGRASHEPSEADAHEEEEGDAGEGGGGGGGIATPGAAPEFEPTDDPRSVSREASGEGLEGRPVQSDVDCVGSTSSAVADNTLQHAHSIRTDEGGTPYESGEENYITILPGTRAGKLWERIPEPVSEGADSASREASPDIQTTVTTEEGSRESMAVSPKQTFFSPEEDRGVTYHSGGRDLERSGGSSPQTPDVDLERRAGSLSTPLHSKATPRSSLSSASTPNLDHYSSNSSFRRGRSNTDDMSFDTSEFHDAREQGGMNGSSDLRSGRTISRDVDFEDDIFSSSRRTLTLAEDLARVDMQGSDDESFYYNGSNTSRYFGDDLPSASYQDGDSDDEFENIQEPDHLENGDRRRPKIVCTGLDLADSLGLTKTNHRLRYLINWLVNSLKKLRHPSPNNQGIALVRIYGPKVKYDRGAAVSFNLFDWKGVFIQPGLVQRLADRSNISLGVGRLCNIVDPELSPDFLAERELWGGGDRSGKTDVSKSRGGRPDGGKSNTGKWDSLTFPVVTAALGFVSSFEDVYRLWSFLAKFLDADFVSKEVWRYHSLNQQTVVV